MVVTRMSVPQANFKEAHALALVLTLLSTLSTGFVYIRLCYQVHERSRQCRSL